MRSAEALAQAMQEAGLRDEDVAVRTKRSAQQIMKIRRGKNQPSFATDQLLRRTIPGYAERVDANDAADTAVA